MATTKVEKSLDKSETPTDLSQAAAAPAPSPAAPTKTDIAPKSKEDIELEQMLDGFKDVQPDKADGWFQPAAGAFILGRLLGRFVMASRAGSKRKPRAFYQIKVKQAGAPKSPKNPNGDVYMVSGKGDDAETLPVQRGNTIAMDERKALEILAGYADSDGVFDVFVRTVEKIDVAGGEQTFWRCEVRMKQLRAPSHPIRSTSPSSADADDEIPF